MSTKEGKAKEGKAKEGKAKEEKKEEEGNVLTSGLEGAAATAKSAAENTASVIGDVASNAASVASNVAENAASVVGDVASEAQEVASTAARRTARAGADAVVNAMPDAPSTGEVHQKLSKKAMGYAKGALAAAKVVPNTGLAMFEKVKKDVKFREKLKKFGLKLWTATKDGVWFLYRKGLKFEQPVQTMIISGVKLAFVPLRFLGIFIGGIIKGACAVIPPCALALRLGTTAGKIGRRALLTANTVGKGIAAGQKVVNTAGEVGVGAVESVNTGLKVVKQGQDLAIDATEGIGEALGAQESEGKSQEGGKKLKRRRRRRNKTKKKKGGYKNGKKQGKKRRKKRTRKKYRKKSN